MMFLATCVMLSLTYLVCVLQLQVLKTWVELTGNIERGTKVGWSRLFQWLDKFAQEDFWLGDRGKCITQVLQQMRAKALYANYVSVHICGVYASSYTSSDLLIVTLKTKRATGFLSS